MITEGQVRPRKLHYRTDIGITLDILKTVQDGGDNGTLISAISRIANLSHYAVLDKCQKLIDASYVELIRAKGRVSFKITEQGILFLKEISGFVGKMDAIKIRY